MAVQRIVGRIEVEHDLLRCLAVGIKEQINEQTFNGTPVHGDLAVAVVRGARRVLQPVQRALATQRRTVGTARLQPVGEQCQDRIEAKVVVVVYVLVAQRQAR